MKPCHPRFRLDQDLHYPALRVEVAPDDAEDNTELSLVHMDISHKSHFCKIISGGTLLFF